MTSFCSVMKIGYGERGEWDELLLPIFASDAARHDGVDHYGLACLVVDALTDAEQFEADCFTIERHQYRQMKGSFNRSKGVLRWKKRLKREITNQLDQYARQPVCLRYFGLALGQS